MALGVAGTLQRALAELEGERAWLDRQIAALQQVLHSTGGNGAQPMGLAPARRGRKRMSAEARKAVSVRMKAYWAQRRRGRGKRVKATVK